MGNTDCLKRVELALCELIVEVAHYELVEVALHKLIGWFFTVNVRGPSFLVFKKQLAPPGIPSFR